MARLSIYLFGPLQVTLDGQPITGFESDKVRALLAYLAAEPGRPHRRETLAGFLWPDCSEQLARASLRRALTNLRQVIDEAHSDPPSLTIDRQSICFNPESDVWVDVKAFAELLESQASPKGAIEQLQSAEQIYRGSFLEEFCIPKSSPFEEWALLQRERLHRQIVSVLRQLAACYEDQNDQEQALRYAWRLVELDPWREESQRRLMRLLASSGQRAAALAQYEACRLSLARELGVELAPETTLLYKRIRDGELVERNDLRSDRAPPSKLQDLPSTPGQTYGVSRKRIIQRLHVLEIFARLTWAVTTRKDRPDWRLAVGGMALVAGVLLFVLFARSLFPGTLGGYTPVSSSPQVQSDVLAPKLITGKVVSVCEQAGPQQICVRDVRTDKITRIANQEFTEIAYPSWSPDGQKIVFCAGREAGGWFGHHLYLMNSDGSNLQQTHSTGFGIHPVWSSDGDWIAFIGEGGLWLMRPDDSEERLLIKGFEWGNIRALAWSPDSRQIAYVTVARSGYAEVWTIQTDGQAVSLVREIDDCIDIIHDGWSADGRQIGVYCLSRERELFLAMNADNSGELETVGFLDDWFPYYWPRWEQAQ
jgi:DNA-binding SARP family transcriptional activator